MVEFLDHLPTLQDYERLEADGRIVMVQWEYRPDGRSYHFRAGHPFWMAPHHPFVIMPQRGFVDGTVAKALVSVPEWGICGLIHDRHPSWMWEDVAVMLSTVWQCIVEWGLEGQGEQGPLRQRLMADFRVWEDQRERPGQR